jgi:hypothetical protein
VLQPLDAHDRRPQREAGGEDGGVGLEELGARVAEGREDRLTQRLVAEDLRDHDIEAPAFGLCCVCFVLVFGGVFE